VPVGFGSAVKLRNVLDTLHLSLRWANGKTGGMYRYHSCVSARNLSNSNTEMIICRDARLGLMSPRSIHRRIVMGETLRYCAASFSFSAPLGIECATAVCES